MKPHATFVVEFSPRFDEHRDGLSRAEIIMSFYYTCGPDENVPISRNSGIGMLAYKAAMKATEIYRTRNMPAARMTV